MVEIIFIIIAIVICTILPMYAKRHFEEKYNTDILMLGPVALNCVALLAIMVMDLKGMDEWISILAVIIVYLLTCSYVLRQAKRISSNRIDIVIAVVANALLPMGIVLVVVMTLLVIFASSEGKKKKR